MNPIKTKLRPVVKIPNAITLFIPNLFRIIPTKGDIIPPSDLCIDMPAAVKALLQPIDSTIGSKKAVNPLQKTVEAYP
tara:strand:+ start:188 stop:421 length:234 start_codon:yes stop_codon:yes gene_type:complete